MPRRGGSSRGASPSRSYARPTPPSRPAPPPTVPASKPPSMMKQMAVTAGGVAAGTVIGHALIGALSPRERRDYYESTYARASPRQLQEDDCGQLLSRLVSCMKMAQESNLDVSEVCSQAESLYLDCRKTYGDPTY